MKSSRSSITSNTLVNEQPPEQTEIIPIVDLEQPPALPPPPFPSPPEDEWGPTPEPTNTKVSASSFSLYGIIPVILGIFSLLLLMLCGFFGHQYFQSIQASESKMKILLQWIESFQNKTENLQIQSVNQYKETLDYLQEQNKRSIEAVQELNAQQGHCYGPPLHPCVKYGDYYYYQSKEIAPWSSCFNICVSLNATFLKTERAVLMNIQVLLPVNQSWLGLSYNKTDNRWEWENGSSPICLNLPKPSPDFQGKCVYVKASTIGNDNCTRSFSCMCEKAVH